MLPVLGLKEIGLIANPFIDIGIALDVSNTSTSRSVRGDAGRASAVAQVR